MSRRTVANVLRTILDERAQRERDVTPRLVVGREPDGAELQLQLDGSCPQRAEGANRIGQVVAMPATRPDHRAGLGGGTLAAGGPGVIWVERQEPPQLRRGYQTEVTIHGRGLVTGIDFVYCRPAASAEDPSGLEPHPGLTVEAAEQVDASTYRLQVRVAADAQLVAGAPIVWTCRDQPHRRDDFYGVVAGGAAFNVYLGRSDVTLAWYDAEGGWIADAGTVAVNPRVDFLPVFGSSQVADGSIAWVTGAGTGIRVWDWAAEARYELELEAGWQAAGVAYVHPYLWWIEWEQPPGPSTTLPTRLCRAGADLRPESRAEIGQYSFDRLLDENWNLFPHHPILYSRTHAALVFSHGGTALPLRYALANGSSDRPAAAYLYGETRVMPPGDGCGVGYVNFNGEHPYRWDGNDHCDLYWMPQGWIDYLLQTFGGGWAWGLGWVPEDDGVGMSRDGRTVYLANQQDCFSVVWGGVDAPEPDGALRLEHPTIQPFTPIQVWPI